ncbi:MAG: hypothetical protein HC803_02375, partial [Saprospiraceae bacterium]|nr:hypothetical protein [Saprospiraceae bacterium]
MGALSSSMAENKIFPVGMLLISGIALFIYGLRMGNVGRLIRYALVFLAIPFVFAIVYNVLVADVRGTPRIEEYLNPDKTESYLTRTKYKEERGIVLLGRGFALSYGWELIQRDT